MHLIRPVGQTTNEESRVDKILEKLAYRGVKIFIIVFNEPTIALTLNSAFTQSVLQSYHPNIIVMRHP